VRNAVCPVGVQAGLWTGNRYSAAMKSSLSLLARQTVAEGCVAGALSALVLLWRGRRDNASAAAPVNAISHWVWPRQALRRNDASVKHTGGGMLIHFASSLLWAGVYRSWRQSRRHAGPSSAVLDAAAVAGLAALVDLKLVPPRLTPGFEHRLRPASLGWVYLSFATGLALCAVLSSKRRDGA
jgi:hypothetical protein